MFVYFHRNPETYQIFYVGIGVRKWRAYDFKTGRNPIWKNYVAKYGNPIIQMVHSGIDEKDAKQWEKFYIKLLGKKHNGGILVNLSDGGDATPILSKESRARSTKALIDWVKNNPHRNPMLKEENKKRLRENNPMHNPDFVDKVRIANIGKKASDETKLKQRMLKIGKPSNQPIGYKHSNEVIERLKIINKEITNRPEVKAKLSLANKGSSNIKNSLAVKMIDINTGEVLKTFPCITDALNIFGKPRSGNISLVCKGKRNKAFGYKWEYAA